MWYVILGEWVAALVVMGLVMGLVMVGGLSTFDAPLTLYQVGN